MVEPKQETQEKEWLKQSIRMSVAEWKLALATKSGNTLTGGIGNGWIDQ